MATFPQVPLPVFVDIAPGANPAGSIDAWDPLWVDITNDARVGQGIEIEEGIPDEANQADPGTCTVVLCNAASKVPATLGQVGCYSPRNPLGPYWGLLAKNTPLRVRLQRLLDSFTRTGSPGWGTADSGSAWTSNAAFSTNGTQGLVTLASANTGAVTTNLGAGAWDFDMTATVAINVLPTGGDFCHTVNFRRGNSSNTYQLLVYWSAGGSLQVFLQRTLLGSLVTIASNTSTGITSAANTNYRFRLKAEGSFIGVKVWLAAGTEPTSWTASVSDQGAYTLDSTALGTLIQAGANRFTGNVATTIAYWDDLVINSYLFIGTVPEWPVRWNKPATDSTVPVKATGVLRRLQQGDNPVKAPLYSYLDQYTPAALYMLEDDSGATTAASQTPGVAGAYIFSTSPSGWAGTPLGGTSGTYTVAVDTTISGVLPRMTPSGAWSFLFAFYMPVLPAVDALMFRVLASGTVAFWDVRASSSFGGVVFLTGTTSDGTLVVNVSVAFVPGRWNVAQVEITQVTTTITGRMVCYDLQTAGVVGSTAPAITGTIGSPTTWALYGSTGFQSAAAGPVVFYPRSSPVSTAALVAAGNGFAGEDAATRIARICAEQGVRLDLLTGTASKLGAQTADSFLAVLAEAADTDIGMLTEFHGALRYRPRGRRYNQNARLALDFNNGQVGDTPEPTDDDQRLRNDVTVNRKNGSSARAFDSANIAVHGKYDTSVDINPYSDADLLSHAAFRLYLGTWDDLRWPLVALSMTANPDLIERSISLDAGALVTIANPPSNLPVGTLQLLVEAVKHTIKSFSWDIELTCSTYQPWRIADTIATANSRNLIDIVGSTLGATRPALTGTDTLSVTNSGGIWSAAAVPFNVNLNGEVMTATAITGTTSQTWTVTRAVNGISKAHAVGEPIHLDAIMYVAL